MARSLAAKTGEQRIQIHKRGSLWGASRQVSLRGEGSNKNREMRRITKSSPAQHNAARDHNGALVMNIYTALPARVTILFQASGGGAAEAAPTNYFLVRCVFAPAKRSTKRPHALTADATAIGNGYFSSLCKARFKSVEKHPRPERELGSLFCAREVGGSGSEWIFRFKCTFL